MVDKSTIGLIVFGSLIIMLTFRDLMYSAEKSVPVADEVDSKKDEIINTKLNLNNEDDSFSTKSFDQDEFSSQFSDASNQQAVFEPVKKIASLKMKSNMQTLKFQFCYSCGYRNMFEQYSHIIRERFPEINIIGENYSPSPYRVHTAQFLSSFKLVIIGVIMFGVNPFTHFNIQTPNFFLWATENKMYATMMIFFISNAIETQLISSGAFEIFLNDIQIWSKLQSERMPHEKELMQIIDMNFNFESQKQSAFG